MQQVLNLIWMNHRKSLAYPENQVDLRYRPAYEEAFMKPRRNFMMNNALKADSKSGQKNGQNEKKEIESSRSRKSAVLTQKLSKEEEILMKKYYKNFRSLDKQTLLLPAVGRNRSSRGEATTRGVQSIVTSSFYKDNLSGVSSEKKQKILLKARKKFRKCVNAIIFVNRLRYACQRNEALFQEIAKLSLNLNEIIMKTINKYYVELMEQPLFQFGQILKKRITNSSYKPTSDIAQNLLLISQNLKTSSLRKDMLKFLALVTLENSPLPHDFFCEFELLRLEFKKNRFMLKRVKDEQVRLVIGIFMGIKMFCNNIFYQPWHVQFLNLPTTLDKKVKPVICAYSSYFYTVITGFYKNMPVHSAKFVDNLKSKGVTPSPIVEQNDEFHDRMFLDFNEQHKKIISNLSAWIFRISGQVIKKRQELIEEFS